MALFDSLQDRAGPVYKPNVMDGFSPSVESSSSSIQGDQGSSSEGEIENEATVQHNDVTVDLRSSGNTDPVVSDTTYTYAETVSDPIPTQGDKKKSAMDGLNNSAVETPALRVLQRAVKAAAASSDVDRGTEGEWEKVQSGRRSRPQQRHHVDRLVSQLAGSRRRSSALSGAKRVNVKILHLSGISPKCCAQDIFEHCRKKGFPIASCFFIRTKVWGTVSAKLFVDEDFATNLLEEEFWPDLIACRLWEREPPRFARAHLD